MKPVLVVDAKLATLQVDIRVLRVGPKQMTQAVFKQLPFESPLDEQLVWKGPLWGYVNYHGTHCPDTYDMVWNDNHSGKWGNDHDPFKHLHVVWQKADELRHGRVLSLTTKGFAPTGHKRSQMVIQDWAARWVEVQKLPQLFIAV